MTIDFTPNKMSNWNEVSEISFKNIITVLLGGIIQKEGLYQIFRNNAEYRLAQLSGLCSQFVERLQ